MSVLSKRSGFLACALLLAAQASLADYPSSRTHHRMAWDPASTYSVLFGGLTNTDGATKAAYDLDETWVWTGERWIHVYPEHHPGSRAMHVMVSDTTGKQVVLFGGRAGTTDFNDTWVWRDNDWKKIETANAPSARILAGAAHDPLRGRTVLFGGLKTAPITTPPTAPGQLFDTWEFDGTDWQQITSANAPEVLKPLLVWDDARDRMLLIGMDDETKPLMYGYDPANARWEEIKPEKMPDCTNEASAVYQSHNEKVLLMGGTCESSGLIDDTWEWDGGNWTKIDPKFDPDRVAGAAMTYDVTRGQAIRHGGTESFGIPRAHFHVFKEGDWVTIVENDDIPAPRSLYVFHTDPGRNVVWLFGGIDENGNSRTDLWQYAGGAWTKMNIEKTPTLCGHPNSAFDTDRGVLVVLCSDATIYEFDGEAWKTFENLKDKPPAREFSTMAYDPNLKRTILFGGYDGINFINQTWTWNGTAWTRLKKRQPHTRSLTHMWYDPTLKKVVLYGGIGRRNNDAAVERFADMWSFDGTQWTEIKNVTTNPGMRYGGQIAVDPRTNRLVLYGGLVYTKETIDKKRVEKQFYTDDMWEWNGSTWTKLSPANTAGVRENASIAYDPTLDELVMFGGWRGWFLSDHWTFKDNTWTLREMALPEPPDEEEPPVAPTRRRAVH